MLCGVTYYITEQGVPDHAQMRDKIDCVIEMIAMYLHHKHPDKSFGFCLPDLVLVGPASTSGQILVRYYINHMFTLQVCICLLRCIGLVLRILAFEGYIVAICAQKNQIILVKAHIINDLPVQL